MAGNALNAGKRILDTIFRRAKHVSRSRRHQDCRQFMACCPTSQTGRTWTTPSAAQQDIDDDHRCAALPPIEGRCSNRSLTVATNDSRC